VKYFLGIDTSCYTTSVALFDETGYLVSDERKLLKVKEGGCGLQQHEMVFQHVRALPDLIEKVFGKDIEIASIGVSGYPRPLPDSYMPAFLTGLGTAKSLSISLHCHLMIQSHQENHLMAALWSVGGIDASKFLMLHASGGTTDVLLVEKNNFSYKLISVGGSKDLHAGQFIDRIGVALGLDFPAGPALEKIAETALNFTELPVSVVKNQVSLSGPATAALKILDSGVDKASLALGVEHCLGQSFGRLLRNIADIYDVKNVVFAGGVAGNKYICQIVKEILDKRQIVSYFAKPCYCSDSAVGNAYSAYNYWVNTNI